MTEYKTFDDYVRNVFKIDHTELTHISPEEQKKKTVKITADELINIWNELTELKNEVDLWKKASENNSFKAFQFEKENAELKSKNKWYSEQVCNKECAEVWGQLDKQIEATLKLDKENKELKSWKCKAETYMNYLIGIAQGSGLEKDNLVLEAEQFLNSEVEK